MIMNIPLFLMCTILCLLDGREIKMEEHLKEVDQVLWIVEDIDNVIINWSKLGFVQIIEFGVLDAECKKSKNEIKLEFAKANLGGANITWIQPISGGSVFSEFHSEHGEGAMALIHRLESKKALDAEINRLENIGISILEEIIVITNQGNFRYILMDTNKEGKYILGYTYGTDELIIMRKLSANNMHKMRLNQYAFAIRNEKPVSLFWQNIGFPPFTINIPVLYNKVYSGKPAEYDLKQGWQKHGTIDYEWCIPLKSPTVYEDFIKKHGEGIHHLAFSVDDIDKILRDYDSKGYRVSMAGTWGEKDKLGSGMFAYIDLESAGGLSLELLWNYKVSGKGK